MARTLKTLHEWDKYRASGGRIPAENSIRTAAADKKKAPVKESSDDEFEDECRCGHSMLMHRGGDGQCRKCGCMKFKEAIEESVASPLTAKQMLRALNEAFDEKTLGGALHRAQDLLDRVGTVLRQQKPASESERERNERGSDINYKQECDKAESAVADLINYLPGRILRASL